MSDELKALEQFAASMADHYHDDLEWEKIIAASLDESGFKLVPLSRPDEATSTQEVERRLTYKDLIA